MRVHACVCVFVGGTSSPTPTHIHPLPQGGWVDVVGGWLGGAPHTRAYTCACMHAHARTRTCGKHDNFMQMAASIGFLGNPWEFPMMSYVRAHACACMHVCVCGGHLLTNPHSYPPTPPSPRGGPPELVKIQ